MLNRAIRFYVAAGILTIGATALPSASIAAVITATVGGVPDGAIFYENFDNLAVSGGTTSTGITVSFSGKGAGTASLPNLAGYYAAPIIMEGSAISFGNSQATGPNETQYLTTGMGQVIMGLGGYHQYFGLLWGSVDDHNLLSFYDDDTLLFSFTGLDVKDVAEGGQESADTFYVNINSADYFNKVIASSTRYGFEFDNVALAYDPISLPIHGEIPEPGTLVLLSLGLFVGIIARRRRSTACGQLPTMLKNNCLATARASAGFARLTKKWAFPAYISQFHTAKAVSVANVNIGASIPAPSSFMA